jgi:DNA uptake protein ComE-like DNA-binding protein
MMRPLAPRRAMIIFAVLIVITIAALVGAAGMYAAEVRVTSAGASLKAAQARALAWSGVQAVMAELGDQRESIIAGHEPLITGEWELFKNAGGGRGIVRLLPVGSGGKKVESESAKLDVNTATAEMLAKLPGWTEPMGAAVVGARSSRPFQSLAELAHLDGFTSEMIEGGAPAGDGSKPKDDAGATSLVPVLTAYSFEPCIQFGVGGGEHRGQCRVPLTSEAALGSALEKRFDGPLGAKLKTVVKDAKDAKTRSDLVRLIRAAGMETADWGRVLDLLEAGTDPYAPGRLDVNRASAEVLACIPGFDASRARKVVDSRAGVASERLASPAWLVEEAILTPEQFEQAANYLSVRSFQWRVVVEAGVTRGGDEDSSRTLAEAPFASRAVLEAVIDISSERPRLAFLRDVTLKDAAREMAARAPAVVEEEPPPAEPAPSPPPAPDPNPPAPKPDAAEPAPPISEGSMDRRLGRWTAGGRSGAQR